MMKKGIARIAAVYMDCPHCGSDEVVEIGSGSFLLVVNRDERFECQACGKGVALPAWVTKPRKQRAKAVVA